MRSQKGVSEVVGTILILAMTVVLFASIILWVSAIPTPRASIRIDMDGALAPFYDNNGVWDGANFTVRHRGGETLFGAGTSVFFTVVRGGSFTTEVLKTRGTIAGVPYGIDGPTTEADWDAGETWGYTNYSVLETDRVTLSVVDISSATIVWMEELIGPAGAHPPVFLEKWLDGDTSTAITRDTPLTNQAFGLYARVEDPDGDLKRDNVSAKYTFGPHATFQLYDDASHGDRVANDGIFTRYDTGKSLLPKLNWDGKIIILKAEDLQGRVTESRLIFKVLKNPNEGEDIVPPSLGPFDLLHRNEVQAFAIYNSTEWDGKRWAANETRTFKKSDVVVVIVASQYLRNLDLLNHFVLYRPSDVPPVPVVYGNAPYDRTMGANTKPSSTRAFTFLEDLNDFYVYEYRFGTDSGVYGHDGVQLDYGQYHLEITLRANIIPPPRNQFNTVDAIEVTDENGMAPDYPVVEFFRDTAHTQPSKEFVFTDKLYVRVGVLDTDAASVGAGDVTISDYIGGTQIWAEPGTAPVSTITVNGTRYYAFNVDLSNPNRDPWVPGRNSYGFQIKLLADSNEDYMLSSQVLVRGPRWSLDIASSAEEFSHPVFSEKWYAILSDNDRLWSPYIIEKFQMSPSQQVPPFGGGKFYQMVLSDLDDDGDLDVAVGIEKGYVFWYRNTGGRGHVWERFTVDQTNPVAEVWALAAGRIDRDLDNDLVAGMKTGQLYWYANNGVWTRRTIATLGVEIKVIKIGDVDMDGDKDVVVGMKDSRILLYKNNGAGSFLPTHTITLSAEVFDLAIADIDNDTDNEIVVATGTNVRIYQGTEFTSFTLLSATNIALSVDIGHMDADGLLDVIGGTETGNVYWWRNGPWSRNTITTITSDKILTLRAGDVDGDLIDDVVIGTEKGWVRWLRQLTTGAWGTHVVLTLTTKIFDIDIGDVDRGVVIDLSR